MVVDYLQLMKTGKEENRAVAIGAISRGLKILAKDLRVPGLLLAQLSRKAEERGKEHPQLSDLRESGSIEQDADMVWFVDRPFYRTRAEEDNFKASFDCSKTPKRFYGRDSPSFYAEFTTFMTLLPKTTMATRIMEIF